MTEYVVEWSHWRRYPGLDYDVAAWKKGKKTAARVSLVWSAFLLQSVPAKVLKDEGYKPAMHGGKTICRIYLTLASLDPLKTTLGEPVASAETICSWRDQFSRPIGRLYSLALALNELNATREDKWRIIQRYLPTARLSPERWGDLLTHLELGLNVPAVKEICAEIVEGWKYPPRRERAEEAE